MLEWELDRRRNGRRCGSVRLTLSPTRRGGCGEVETNSETNLGATACSRPIGVRTLPDHGACSARDVRLPEQADYLVCANAALAFTARGARDDAQRRDTRAYPSGDLRLAAARKGRRRGSVAPPLPNPGERDENRLSPSSFGSPSLSRAGQPAERPLREHTG